MEISKKYSKAYVEVLSIVKEMEEEDYKKIPKDILELYEHYIDKDYIFIYDKSKLIKEQISEEAKVVLANLFIKYIANDEEKQKILAKRRKEFYEKEKQKQSMELNPLFHNKRKTKLNSDRENMAMIKIEEKNGLQKIFFKIKQFFKGGSKSVK